MTVGTPISVYVNATTPKNTKNPESWNVDGMCTIPLSAKRWNTIEKHNVSMKPSTKQKRYSLRGMKMVIQACGLFGTTGNTSPTPVKVYKDASTQTEEYHVSPPILTRKVENIFSTPEKKIATPNVYDSTPKNVHLLFNRIKRIPDVDAVKEYSVNQQKLLNVITPKRNFLNNCNNYTSNINVTPRVPPPLFDNVTPVTTKQWRANNISRKERNCSISNPKSPSRLSKILRKTSVLQKKYALATVMLLKDACKRLKKIALQSRGEVRQFWLNNVGTINDNVRNEEMFLILRKEIEELKTMVKDLKSTSLQAKTEVGPASVEVPKCMVVSTVPPPPPPPPLPLLSVAAPPPPPPMPISMPPSNKLSFIKKSNTLLQNNLKNEEMRPSISVEDILKVKLRKPCERAQSLPKSTPRPQNGPMVTIEALKQVRLKRVSTTSLAKENDSSNCSNSPVSSLKRLLANGSSSESRAKRRRRTFVNTPTQSFNSDRSM